MSTESIDLRVAQALLASIAAIVGDAGTNYWRTPDKVVLYHDLNLQCLDATLNTTYVLIPDRVDRQPHANKRVQADAFFDLCLVAKVVGVDNPYSQPDPSRQALQTRTASDVAKKLLGGDQTLGGLTWATEITNTEYGPAQTYMDGWALSVLRIVCRYLHWNTAA